MPVKHATSSVYLFAWIGGDWRLGMIEHPRLGGLLVPGGHVEADETPAEAAVRELREETGLEGRFLTPPECALPAGYPHEVVPPPWWTVEIAVSGDNHVAQPHVHVDHHYIAVADRPDRTVGTAEHPLHWVTAQELPGLETPLDVRVLGAQLFGRIGALAAPGGTGRQS
ncbi:NUDIX domain-containing protein [Peterkaempfera sp. SMS 1(5)a]|uniref:NUDIX domain-containing protein n=1 Tax=Peterkaempfera podocarpi TaxID=3232308 RepID=UPI00366F2903